METNHIGVIYPSNLMATVIIFQQFRYKMARPKSRVIETIYEKILKVSIYICIEGKIFCQNRIPFKKKVKPRNTQKLMIMRLERICN